MRRLLRSPLLHFIAGGCFLFAIVRVSATVRPASDATVAPLVLAAADVEQLRREHRRNCGGEPSAEEESALVERAIESELLFREAIARGLDRDRSVRNWLVEQMRSLDPEAGDDDAALYEQALALGLDRTDMVVRRILTQKMRLLAAREGERDPTDAELREFYERHAADYEIGERLTVWHVYTGDASRRAAEQLLNELRRDGVKPAEGAVRGETFTAPPHLRAQSRADLERRFGKSFTDSLRDAPTGEWSGPFSSPYGWHLVWVEQRTPAETPSLDVVRGQVRERWLDTQRRLRYDAALLRWRSHYPLHIESPAWRAKHSS